MANWLNERVLRRIAAATAIFTLAVGVGLPLLDISSVVGAAFEADHEHGCLVADHDHSICNQFGNKQLSTDKVEPRVVLPPILAVDAHETAETVVTVSVDTPAHPRAPPFHQIAI